MRSTPCALPFLLFAACSDASQSAVVLSQGDATDSAVDATDETIEPDAGMPTEAGPDDEGAPAIDGATEAGPIGGDRPVPVHVPPGYVPGHPTPLVILLHGYGVAGWLEDLYLTLTPLSNDRGFLYAYPDGTVDGKGS